MKNLFFVSVAFSLFTGTSLSTNAQSPLKFIENTIPTLDFKEAAIASSDPLISRNSKQVFTTVEKNAGDKTEMLTSVQFKYAMLLNREVETISNLPLYSFIDDWYGTRYRYGGTSKKGIDCSSLTNKLLKEVYDIEIPRTAREQYANCFKLQSEQIAEGDLVFFNTRGGISHVGLYLADGYFVHASSSAGVTISHLEETYFKQRFIGAGRINVIDYSRILL